MKRSIEVSKDLLLRVYLTQITTFCFIIFLCFVIFFNGVRDEKAKLNIQNERYLGLIVSRLDFTLAHMRHVANGETSIEVLFENKDYIDSVYIIDENSRILEAKNEQFFLNQKVNYNFFKNCVKDGGYCAQKFPYNNAKPNSAYLALAVAKNNDIIIAFVDIKKMASQLLDKNAMVLDKDGYFINDDKASNIYDAIDLSQEFKKINVGFAYNYIDKKWQIYSINYIEKLGLGLFTSENFSDVFAQRSVTLILLLFAFVLFIIMSLDLIFFSKKGILMPIKELRTLFIDLGKNKIRTYDFKNNKEFFNIYRNVMKQFFTIKYAQGKLEFYRSQHDLLLDNSPLVVLYIDAKTSRIVACSNAACEFYGYSKSELLTKSFFDLNYDKSTGSHLSNVNDLGNKIAKFSAHATAKGEKKTVQVLLKPIDEGYNAFYLAVITDVSEVADLYYMLDNAKDLTQSSPMVIIGVDKQYKITQITDNATTVLKQDKRDILNTKANLSSLICKTDKMRDIMNFMSLQERIGSNDAYDDLMQIKLGNGVVSWFRVYARLNSSYDSLYANIFMVDISEIYDKLLSYRRLLERYDQQIQGSSLITWEYDIQSKTYNFSNSFFKLIGYKEVMNDMSISMLSKIIPQTYLQLLLEEQEKAIQDSNYNFTLSLRVLPRQKDEIWIELKGRYAQLDIGGSYDESGESKKRAMIIGMLEDISEEVRTDSRLNLLAQIFSHSREGITITDADQNIIETNKAFEAITGYTSGEVIGKKPSVLQSGSHSNEYYKDMWNAINNEGFWRGEIVNKRKNGELCPEILSISAVRDRAGELTNYIGIFTDITELKEKEESLRKIAFFDGLTGLPNKTYFIEEIQKRMQKASVGGTTLAILYMDLDGFKKANDTYGHHCGDEVLIEVAKRLKAQMKSFDIVSRFGGDEFVAIVNDVGNELKDILNNILEAINKEFIIGDYTVKIGTTIGVAFYPQKAKLGYEELLEQADWAMYQAKLAGKNRYYIFDDTSAVVFKEYKNILAKLDSYNTDNFEIMYMPYYDSAKKSVASFEIYVRLKGALNILSANDFSNMLSQKYWYSDLNIWLIKNAIKEFRKLGLNDISLNINISVSQLNSSAFFKNFSELASELSFKNLNFKVTDLFAARDVVEEAAGLKRYLSLGVGLVFDDLSETESERIDKMPQGEFNVHKSYIDHLLDDYTNIERLEYILSFCKQNQKIVGVKGVKNAYAYKILSVIGFGLLSGAFLHEPVDASKLGEAINSFSARTAELANLKKMDMPSKQSALNFYKFIIHMTSSIDGLCRLFDTGDITQFSVQNYVSKFNELKSLQDESLSWCCDEVDKQIRHIIKNPRDAKGALEALAHEKLNLLNSIIGE